ncbi:MAG: glycosyltransferase family 2 protein [Acidobacteriota bacterium]
MKVSVAILSWNGRQHLGPCLEALAGQRDPGVPWEVLVLDNGSSDGTAEWLRKEWLAVDRLPLRLVESRHNLGFCAGNNRLVRQAEGDAVAFLNNDTRPRQDWLAALVEGLRRSPPDIAAVSGRILDWEGERLDFARGVMTFDGHAFQMGFRRPLDRLRPVDDPADGEELFFACGGNMLIRKESFLAAGGFDEDYFAYLEDVDLGWRLWAGGERVRYVADAVVHHRSSATSDLLGLYHRGFLFERNAFVTAYKNYEDGLWQRVMPAVQWALASRTQTLLVQNNPGGEILTQDPYAGMIANTGNGEEESEARSEALPIRRKRGRPIWLKPRTFARHLKARLAGGPHPVLTDHRTVAQLRAQTWILGHLDRIAAHRAAVQARRKVSDAYLFERFPVYLVPTYPGDELLFARKGFRRSLPADLPLVDRNLEEVMEVEGNPSC